MQVYSVCRRPETLLGFLLILLFSVSFCYGDDKVVEVIGTGECGDCSQSNIKSSHALSGLKVTVDCKRENGNLKRRGVGELNGEGNFKISLPQEILKDGKLTEECYVQLHNAANAPCAVQDGTLDAMKIVLLSKSDQKHTFGTPGKLKFSSAICTSAFLWPHFKYPPLPKLPHWPKKHPFFGHYFPLPPKVYKPPVVESPPVPPPVYKPKPEPPVVKPEPKPPKCDTKPKPPVYEPTPVPEHKPMPKPKPPIYKPAPVPTYKPKPPVQLPPVPIYKPKPPVPIYKPTPKPPLPPLVKPLPPPLYKKPCPPFPLPKLPPFPTIPPKDFHHLLPKYFHHHIIKDFPPLPPMLSHP
ncbi:hypothetical protein E3N88_31318 [Mikania micrantha]|uniref:Proline-rich protein n=1 Tax=Mikania micrantha TaxID=192012 RepID=A0A5N6MS16_9ASTR|nr:hypothetical protein E3N88_31318 [Mikania micrantha]